jgi:hypothetical protein
VNLELGVVLVCVVLLAVAVLHMLRSLAILTDQVEALDLLQQSARDGFGQLAYAYGTVFEALTCLEDAQPDSVLEVIRK